MLKIKIWFVTFSAFQDLVVLKDDSQTLCYDTCSANVLILTFSKTVQTQGYK